MIITRQSRIPFSWLLMTLVPWVFFYFLITAGGTSFYILNRLIDNPAGLTFALSLPGLLFMFVPLGPYISYTADRIWTRWGRRKVFLVVGFTGVSLVMLAYPLAPTVWIFIGLMFLAAFFGCFNTPFEALKLEIIPPAMRGRTAAIGTWISTAVNILFNMTVIGRFDEVIPFMGFRLTGEKLVFWSASSGLLIAVFVYLFGIHEMPPNSSIRGEKFSLKKVFRALTAPQLRYLYVFGVAASLLAANLGSLGALLYINQWGYSLQEMGFNIAVGGVLNLFIIPTIGFFADKGKGKNRMKIWISCLILILLLNITYFSYVTWYLPDQRPSLVEMIFFGELICVVGIVAGVVYYPLVYDYIPRNLMGTYFAGASMIGGISSFVTINGLGLFMLCWAKFFQPPAGEMARVCLAQEMSGAQVAQILSVAHLSTPDGAAVLAKDIDVRPWYANGIIQKRGICHEIRLRDNIAEEKRARQKALEKEIGVLEAKKLAADEKNLAAKRAENAALTEELNRRAEFWSHEVFLSLDRKLISPGGEILGTTKGEAAVTLLPTLRKAKDAEVDKLNKTLRAEDPAFVGMRIINRGRNFFLSIARMLPEEGQQHATMDATCERVTLLAESLAPGTLSKTALHTEVLVKPVLAAEIALVENPGPTFVSPISKAANVVLSCFTKPPPPDQKLISLARKLGNEGESGNARVDVLASRSGLRVTKVFDAEAQEQTPDALVKQVSTEAASLKLTVPAAFIDKGVVPLKYNYLAGYVYIFIMVLCGFGLVGFFLKKEKAGVVKKLGAQEAEAAEAQAKKEKEEAAAMGLGNDPRETLSPETYTPGYLLPKLLFAALGLAIMSMAIKQAWPQLRLLSVGESTEAVAVSVCAQKPAKADEIMRSQAELDKKTKAVTRIKDYNWTFYNEFTFVTREGKEVTFRREVGCRLKPPMQLLDASGLPVTAKLLYDPKDPSCTVLPLEYSSWFVPVLVCVLGFVAFLVGSTLALFARKPIQITDLHAAQPETAAPGGGDPQASKA